MYGNKILLTGLTLILSAPLLSMIPSVEVVGQVLMIIGIILTWLDK